MVAKVDALENMRFLPEQTIQELHGICLTIPIEYLFSLKPHTGECNMANYLRKNLDANETSQQS